MAARYWVGGTGNWSDAANHWSDTSGGAPGAGFLPTSADDVYFNGASSLVNFNVSISADAYCKNMDWTGIVSAIFYNTVNQVRLNIYGSLILSPNLSINWSSQRYISFKATTNETITFNGCVLNVGVCYFDGVGGKWSIQDDGQICGISSGAIWVNNGELDVNNKILTLGATYIGVGTKTITLGSGTIKTRTLFISSATGFTFNYDTGTIYIGLYRSTEIYGSFTFYNLTIETGAEILADAIVNIRGNQTVLNNLVINGTNGTSNRILVKVNNNFVPEGVTITANNVSVANADFYGIKGAGAGNWDLSAITGGAGDGGRNSDIIFTTPKTCYWYGNSGNWSDVSKWFSATGGTGTPNYFPLLHDTIIFDSNSLISNSVLTLDYSQIGHITFTDIGFNLTINGDSIYRTPYFYSSVYFSTLITYMSYGSNQAYLWGNGTHYLDLKSVNIKTLYNYGYGGTYTLLSKFLATVLYNYYGTFDTDSKEVELSAIANYSGTLYFRDSYILITGNTGQPFYATGIIYAGTSTIEIYQTGSSDYSFVLGNSSKTIYNLIIGGTSTGFCLLRNNGFSHVYNRITLNAGVKIKIYYAATSTVKQSFKEFIANGSESKPIIITSDVANQHKLHCTGYADIIVNYCNISYSNVTGTPKIKTFFSKTWASINKAAGIAKAGIKRIMGIYVNSAWIANNSTDSGNNSGWNFN
jgi:hypothetical protein